MTTSIVNLTPSDGSVVKSRRLHVGFQVVSDDALTPIEMDNISVGISGKPAIFAGVTQPGFSATITDRPDLLGFDVSILTPNLDENRDHGIDIFVGASLVSTTTFTVPFLRGPRISAITPAMGSDNAATTPTITIDIESDDAAATVVLRSLQAEANDGVLTALELRSASIVFTGCVGRCVEIAGTPVFITAVLGPNIAVVTTGATPGAGLNVKLFRADGLDVAISDNVRPVTSGVARTGTGWTAVLSQPTVKTRRVVLTRTGAAFAVGKRIDIGIIVSDDSGRSSLLAANFVVGSRKPPVIGSVTPQPGSVGLSTSLSPTFWIRDVASSVTLASVQVEVDGVVAVLNGVPQGIYSTSTVVGAGGGFNVTLTRTGGWTTGRIVPVTVRASDASGNAMQPVSWVWHFGTTVGSTTLNVANGQLNSDVVVRVLPFDFTGTSFAEPAQRLHTGYAADGFWYERGVRVNGDRATWSTEATSVNRSARDDMPVSGAFIVGPGSWSVVDEDGRMWMRCQALAIGNDDTWSFAGLAAQPLADAAMTPNVPTLFLAAGKSIIQVSFVEDAGCRTTKDGRQLSVGGIGSRNADQAGDAIQPKWALSSSSLPFQALAAWTPGRGSWFAAGLRGGDAELIWNMATPEIDDITAVKQEPLNFDRKAAVLATGLTAPWARARATGLASTLLLAAAENKVVVVDWARTLGALAGVVSTVQTPALTPGAVADIDTHFTEAGELLMLVAQAADTTLVDMSSPTSPAMVQRWSLADLGISGQATGVSAVAMDRALDRDAGYVYVAGSGGTGAVARFRHQRATAVSGGRTTVLLAGVPNVKTLAPMSVTPHATTQFVGMDIRVVEA